MRTLFFVAAAFLATPSLAQDVGSAPDVAPTQDEPPAAAADVTAPTEPAAPAEAAQSAAVEAPPAEPAVEAAPAEPATQAASVKIGPEVCATERGLDYVEPDALSPGMGRVIFFRPQRLQGAALSFRVRAGEVEYCTLNNGTYFVVDLAPGAYQFDTRGEVRDYLPLEIEPDETYYVEGRLGMAVLTMRPNLAPSSPAVFDSAKGRLNQSRY
jgi:hypothetical protein